MYFLTVLWALKKLKYSLSLMAHLKGNLDHTLNLHNPAEITGDLLDVSIETKQNLELRLNLVQGVLEGGVTVPAPQPGLGI